MSCMSKKAFSNIKCTKLGEIAGKLLKGVNKNGNGGKCGDFQENEFFKNMGKSNNVCRNKCNVMNEKSKKKCIPLPSPLFDPPLIDLGLGKKIRHLKRINFYDLSQIVLAINLDS